MMTKPLAVSLALVAAGCAGASPAKTAVDGGGDATDPAERAAVSAGMIEVEVVDVKAVRFGGAVVLLQAPGGVGDVVPVFVGDSEAAAIAMRVTRQKHVRPMTHDLFEAVLAGHGIRVLRMEIDDIKSNVFLGRLFLIDRSGMTSRLDARPSDGIALALGAEAPIYISRSVMEQSGTPADGWRVDEPPGEPGADEERRGPPVLDDSPAGRI